VDDFEEPRRRLVETLRQRGIADERVLAAIGRVRREAYLPPDLADRAYENVALPIGQGQTISQPYVVALMTQLLALGGDERVLEVGTGSGYQAAILAELARTVVSVERVPALSHLAGQVLARLGYTNVELHPAGETLGWPAGAPYDRIIVTAAGPAAPPALVDQLTIGGRLVMPVGTLGEQQLMLFVRTPEGVEEASFGGVRFVPLIGEGAWPEGSTPPRSADPGPPPEPEMDDQQFG
jgi:protein-L-isoaspartate(D-aspartate) O-methyltransferase